MTTFNITLIHQFVAKMQLEASHFKSEKLACLFSLMISNKTHFVANVF